MVNYCKAIKMIGKESANIYNNIREVFPDIHNPYVRIYYKCELEEELSINLGTTEISLAHLPCVERVTGASFKASLE